MGCGSSKHVREDREEKSKTFDDGSLLSVSNGNVKDVEIKQAIIIQDCIHKSNTSHVKSAPSKVPTPSLQKGTGKDKGVEIKRDVTSSRSQESVERNGPAPKAHSAMPSADNERKPSQSSLPKQNVVVPQEGWKADQGHPFASYGSKCFIGALADKVGGLGEFIA